MAEYHFLSMLVEVGLCIVAGSCFIKIRAEHSTNSNGNSPIPRIVPSVFCYIYALVLHIRWIVLTY